MMPPASDAPSESDSPDGAALVRGLLSRVQTGVLATHSVQCAGYPFGSAAPFAVGPDACPLFWFSELAEHTRNLRVDPRACLYVRDDGDREGTAGAARVALLGKVTPVDARGRAAAESVYRARFPPPPTGGSALGGFSYWRLDIERVRWIAGFGRMGWLTWSASGGALTREQNG